MGQVLAIADKYLVEIWQAIAAGGSFCCLVITVACYKWSKRNQEITVKRLDMQQAKDDRKYYDKLAAELPTMSPAQQAIVTQELEDSE